jgi:fatty acid desaturase
MGGEEAAFVPEMEQYKVIRTARIWTAIYVATIVVALLTHSWIPIVLIGGPRVYGTFMHLIYGISQHAGLGENVIDHRLNTRTVLMNPINRFLYWNMNFHIEHHMFPMVPYHQLPALHEEIKGDLPTPYPSIWAAYKEIVPAILRQLKDQSYYIKRELPATANPYHGPVDGLLPDSASA